MNDRPGFDVRSVHEADELRQRLEEADERFRIFRELTSDFVYVATVQPDGSFENTWLSESFQSVFGRDVEALTSIGWRELVHPADHDLARQRVKDLVRGKTFDGVVRIFDTEGVLHFIEDRARPVRDKTTGRVSKIYGVAKDITRRRRAEAMLRHDHETYRRLVERSPVPILVHSAERIVFANVVAATTLAAESPDALLGLSIWDFVHEDEIGLTRRRLNALYARKQDGALRPGRLRRLDGDWIEVELMSSRTDYRGRPAAEVAFQDVTERNRIVREREIMTVRAMRAQKMESLGALAAGIAHDFNNILVGVLGHADLALDTLAEDAPARSHLDEIGHGAQHAAELVEQLLDFAGEKRLTVRRVDLSALVGEMAGLLAGSLKQQTRVDYELASDLPRIEVDPTQVKQVLTNLVINAAEAVAGSDAIDAPVIRVRTLIEETAVDDTECYLADPTCRRVVLEVADDGVGMDEWTQRRLFEPFYTTKPTGRGLGMATVLGIVRGHRGALSLDSAPGVGTTIRIAFAALP
ncbi:MAG: PAS domain S-box protein [Acidobacteriota bacterium]